MSAARHRIRESHAEPTSCPTTHSPVQLRPGRAACWAANSLLSLQCISGCLKADQQEAHQVVAVVEGRQHAALCSIAACMHQPGRPLVRMPQQR